MAGNGIETKYLDADWFQRPPVLYYHPDHLGSTQYVTDQDQALSQHVEYLPSGELWADQTDSRYQNRQPYLFNGKELDLSTGLYHYGARSYEPRLGVWLSPDPVLAGYMAGRINGGVYRPINLGLYTYTWNNPVVFIDPDGRYSKEAAQVVETAVKAVGPAAAAAVAEPTPFGEVIVVGAVILGGVGLAGYLIYDAVTDGDPPKASEAAPAPAPPAAVPAPPPPPAAGGGGAKEPPKPPAAVAAEPPKKPAARGGAPGTRPGQPFTKAGKDEVWRKNAATNDGVNKCDNCGTELVRPQKHTRGVRPPGDEGHVDRSRCRRAASRASRRPPRRAWRPRSGGRAARTPRDQGVLKTGRVRCHRRRGS
ncbi:RHS repeat-associated core domain-containing protein [Sorangium sp. So ce375]|uniref:RHS repeat-associated core domain-containing protein n=1 Tax=Sorangium sp. So ce375 TaxID=3133306 RepID=UPI003F5C3070